MRILRLLCAVLASAMLLVCTPALAAEPLLILPAPTDTAWLVPKKQTSDLSFSDVGDTAWCAGAVTTCWETGLLEGYFDGTFHPEGALSCAQVTAISARLYSLLTGGDGRIPLVYDDAPWYQGYYQYLAPMLGYNSWTELAAVCTPDSGCSRGAFAQLLCAVLEKAGVTLSERNTVSVIPDGCPGENTGFLAGATVEKDWYASIISLYNAGILQGVDKYGTLYDRTLNRAQAAAMLARLVDPAQRLTFTLESFDLCRDILGLDKDTVVATIGDANITAEQFSYAFAVRFTSGSTMGADGTVPPLAQGLPESMADALRCLKREYCAAELGVQLGYSPTAAETAALRKEAQEKSGYGGLSEEAWRFELGQTAALEYAWAHYETIYGATPSPLLHQDGGGEVYFLNALCALEDSTPAALTPALENLDWTAVARRIAASPYRWKEILARTVLCGNVAV